MLRIWIFRVLVAAAAALMIASAVMPWWTCIVEHSQYGYQATVVIHQYGIIDAPLEVAGDITPPFQIFLGKAYIVVCVLLVLWCTFWRRKWGQLVMAFVGLSYIGYALAAAYLVIGERVAELGGMLEGYSEIMIQDVGELVNITTALQRGYYLAYVAGGLMVVLALLWPLITEWLAMPKAPQTAA